MTAAVSKLSHTCRRKLAFFIALLIGCLILASAAPAVRPVYAGGNGVYTKLTGLKSKFPDGKFWNHQVTTNSNNGDQLMAQRNESYANTVTSTPCRTHHGTAYIGQYDCNYFDGGIQCMGFAKKVFYDVFGQRESSLPKRYDTQNLMVGDYVRINGNTHSGVVLSISGNTMRLVECNFDKDGAHHNCWIKWGYVNYSKTSITYFKHATNYDSVNNSIGYTPASQTVPTITWQNARGTIGTNDATIRVTAKASTRGRYSQASGTLYDARGYQIARKVENAYTTGSTMDIWYAIRSEMGKTLPPGATYYIRFTTTFDGRTYASPYYRFSTRSIAPTKVTLSKGSVWIRKGRTYTLRATVAPANATNKRVTWRSSNTRIATVTSSGKVKAVRRGTCTITATTANGKRATCKIRVY